MKDRLATAATAAATRRYNQRVATAVDRPSQRAESLRATQSGLSLPEAWHLFNLDAPTIAALWAWFFARALYVRLPWHAPLLLALGTWLIYVADRLLDGYAKPTSTALRRRHHFHAEHRAVFLAAAGIGGSILAWLILTRMTQAARYEDSVLFLGALVYFFLVHSSAEARGWLPKELAVGVVFAAASAVPAWSRLGSGRLVLLPAVMIFAGLCWLNCVAIERWEGPGDEAVSPGPRAAARAGLHVSTRWAVDHLQLAVRCFVVLGMGFSVGAAIVSPRTLPLYGASIAAGVCLIVIDRSRMKLSAMQLRIAADAALLTPLLFLPFL